MSLGVGNRVYGAKFFALILAVFALPALAAVETPSVSPTTVQAKTFQTWKDLQILEAQNQLLRIGARISQIKSGRGSKADVKEFANLPSTRVKSAADADPLAVAEKDMKRARESLEAANGLELEDYVNIYLPTLESQPEALQALFQKMTKEELADILKAVLTRNSRIDTKRNSPVVGGLTVGPSSTN